MFFLAIFFNPNQNYIVLKKHFFEQVLGLTEGFEGALKLENPSMLLTLANPQELLLFKSHPQSTCVCVHIYYIRDIHTYNDTYPPPPADARGSASRITGFCFWFFQQQHHMLCIISHTFLWLTIESNVFAVLFALFYVFKVCFFHTCFSLHFWKYICYFEIFEILIKYI